MNKIVILPRVPDSEVPTIQNLISDLVPVHIDFDLSWAKDRECECLGPIALADIEAVLPNYSVTPIGQNALIGLKS
jgi:hypothetical protein